MILNGNSAIVKGALKAKIEYFGGYPITPSSEIMHELFLHEKDGVVVKQMEDEIASINSVVGAAVAGKRAMTATSGPGFSLMQEGIGLGFMYEAPFVLALVQRVGPSTGMPTKPSQQEIMQLRYGTHGDFCPIAFYPSTIEELVYYTIISFKAAEEALSPTFLLSDGFLARLQESYVEKDYNIVWEKPKRRKLRHFTGLVHDERGFPNPEDFEEYERLLKKLFSKIKDVAKNYEYYQYVENDSDVLIISFGFVFRMFDKTKENFSFFRPIRIWPFLEKPLKKIINDYSSVVVVEANNGQYFHKVREIREDVKFLRVYNPFVPESFLVKKIEKII